MSFVRHDYAFPFTVDQSSRQTAEAAYPAHVDEMVRQLLLTTPGERVNLPRFGCGLRSLVFAASSDALEATVKLRVIQGLAEWLSGVVTVGEVVLESDASLDPGTIAVTVTYTLVETQTTETVTVTIT